MCRPKGVYRADGAMGQFTIVVPDKDLIIAINETASGAVAAQRTLDVMWEFLDRIPDGDSLPADDAASSALSARMQKLALPREPYAPFSSMRGAVNNTLWRITSGTLMLANGMTRMMSGGESPAAVKAFEIRFTEDACVFTLNRGGDTLTFVAAIDGTCRRNLVDGAQVLASAAWTSDDTLLLTARFIEGCHIQRVAFRFKGTGSTITQIGGMSFGQRAPQEITAARV
jgi:hypothetical protein